MDHQIAVIQPIFRLGIQRNKVILWLTFAGHHADIVTAHKRIQPGNAGQGGFRRDQPELRFGAQGILHIRLNARPDLDFVQPFAKGNILHGTHFHPLEANGGTSGDNAVRRLEINRDGTSAIFIARPDKPACDHQRDDRQQPEWRNAAFCFNSRFSRRSGRFLTHVRPKVSGCPAIPLQE